MPTPITILTGFLGAGKTTLLNRILHADHGLRVAVLVNDFGAINIDAQLVVGVEGDGSTITLSNGCICCTLRDDLLTETLRLLARPESPEYILIEASGVSDPAGIALTFLQPELRDVVRLDSIITVVDAENILTLTGPNEVLAIDQIAVADLVILNKIDLVDAISLEKVRNWLARVAPKARVLPATHADVPFELLLGVGSFDPAQLAERTSREVHVHTGHTPHHDHSDHDLIFDSWSYFTDQPLVFRAVQAAINQLPTTVYRAKGILYLDELPEKRAILHVTGPRVTLTPGDPWGQQPPYSQFVVIASHGGLDPTALTALFDGCQARNRRKALNPFAATLEWLRSAWEVNRLDSR